MTSKQIDILVIGGGAAGLTLSVLLGQAGLSVHVVDPAPPKPLKDTPASGRTVALMNDSMNIIKAAGVWEALAERSAPLQTMRIIDISRPVHDPVRLEFPASDLGFEQFGYNIPGGYLRAALYEAAQAQENITIHKAALESYVVEDGRVSARLDNGTDVEARLIVGADGRASKVRETAGIGTAKREYDQSAITCLINHSHAHENVSTEFHKQDGPLAIVPLPGNQSSVVWVETRARAEELMGLKPSDFESALQEKMQDLLGGLTLETPPESWPLCCIKSKALIAPRTALIAETAHVMSPITAQGLNLSLRDVAALAETLVDGARLGLDIGSAGVLNRYAKRRRLDIETRVFGVDSINRAVSSHSKTLKTARRAGLKFLEKVAPAKYLAMQTGLTPHMDQGRLAKGDAL
ncbi:MAG: FAD-dependent monooxygenase [Alphaproteobacteria bacterium]|nr:FAD-dependent monooxygenase [Alphaproteobacteria bacterium]